MAEVMTAGHIAPAGGGFEPQRVFNWKLTLPGLTDPEVITLSIESIRMPQISTAVIKQRYLNEDVKVSGGASVGDNQIVVRDYVDRPVFKVLNEWMEQVHNPVTGAIGFASDYKKQGVIRLLDPKGNTVRTIIAKGMWPNSLTAAELNYATDTGDMKITLSLQVDKYEFNL